MIKEVAKGTIKDVVKMTTGLGKGGAAYPIAKKMMTDTGYMVKRGIGKVLDRIASPKKDYTKWQENIRKGKAEDNLK